VRSNLFVSFALSYQGATIVDQPVCITRWGCYDDNNFWQQTWSIEEETVVVCIYLMMQHIRSKEKGIKIF
jgi:hypothetical protein